VEGAGHKVLFLSKYSPDLNDIEHDFSALKKVRVYAPSGTPQGERTKMRYASIDKN
jgi:putative transposase